MSGRTSRRSLMKRAAALGLGAPLVAGLMRIQGAAAQDATPGAGSPAAGGATGKVEIFSWWTSGGEAAGLDELFKAFTAANPGAQIVNSTVAGGGGNNAQAVLQSRLSANNPPDGWQTHIGHELFDKYVTPGYAADISALWTSENWAAVDSQGPGRPVHRGRQAVLDSRRRAPRQRALVQQKGPFRQRHHRRRHPFDGRSGESARHPQGQGHPGFRAGRQGPVRCPADLRKYAASAPSAPTTT